MTPTTISRHHGEGVRRIGSTPPIAIAAILAVLTPLVLGLITYIDVVRTAIFYPYGLDYGEGVVWAQIREIAAGRGYAPIAHFGTTFLDHLILYNMNSVEWQRLPWIVDMLSQHALFVAVAVYTLACWVGQAVGRYRGCDNPRALRRALAGSPEDSRMLILVVYGLVATAMLLTIVKAGSSYNYFIEWLCIVAILCGLGMRDLARMAFAEQTRTPAPITARVLVALALALQCLILPDRPLDSWNMGPQQREVHDRLAEIIRTQRKPIISNDLGLLLRAGKAPVWDPFTLPEIAAMGQWDDRPFIERIRRHEFALFITDHDADDPLAGAYGTAVGAAVARAYPQRRHIGSVLISMPLAAN